MNSLNFDVLLQDYNRAYKTQEWNDLEKIGQGLGELIGGEFKGTVRDIREISRIYLGSLIGSGDFLTKSDSGSEIIFANGVSVLENYIGNAMTDVKTSLTSLVKASYEIQLFLLKKQAASRNKAASALRTLARPDLAILLATQQLEITRLNYYSLVVRASAYNDLSNYSKAIIDGQKALKFSPPDKKYFSMVTLAKAYVNRFRQTGEISDAEVAFDLAEESFKLKPDEYSANTFLNVIYSMGLTGMEDLITELQNVEKTQRFLLDDLAIQVAKEVIRNSSATQSVMNWIQEEDALADELFDDWLDLELEDDFQGLIEDTDQVSDYFEDYFEEYVESLNDPQSPHLEP
jgi:tetratricopeptide (TPR) repeat protein